MLPAQLFPDLCQRIACLRIAVWVQICTTHQFFQLSKSSTARAGGDRGCATYQPFAGNRVQPLLIAPLSTIVSLDSDTRRRHPDPGGWLRHSHATPVDCHRGTSSNDHVPLSSWQHPGVQIAVCKHKSTLHRHKSQASTSQHFQSTPHLPAPISCRYVGNGEPYVHG